MILLTVPYDHIMNNIISLTDWMKLRERGGGGGGGEGKGGWVGGGGGGEEGGGRGDNYINIHNEGIIYMCTYWIFTWCQWFSFENNSTISKI